MLHDILEDGLMQWHPPLITYNMQEYFYMLLKLRELMLCYDNRKETIVAEIKMIIRCICMICLSLMIARRQCTIHIRNQQ